MSKINFLFPEEAEAEVQAIRETEGLNKETEKIIIKNLVENAKVNSRIGDKVLLCIEPKYIHYPEWQREIKLPKALEIGNNYDSKRMGLPIKERQSITGHSTATILLDRYSHSDESKKEKIIERMSFNI